MASKNQQAPEISQEQLDEMKQKVAELEQELAAAEAQQQSEQPAGTSEAEQASEPAKPYAITVDDAPEAEFSSLEEALSYAKLVVDANTANQHGSPPARLHHYALSVDDGAQVFPLTELDPTLPVSYRWSAWLEKVENATPKAQVA